MSKLTIYVGLDYHQKAVQVCVMDQNGQVLANDARRNSADEVLADGQSGRWAGGCSDRSLYGRAQPGGRADRAWLDRQAGAFRLRAAAQAK